MVEIRWAFASQHCSHARVLLSDHWMICSTAARWHLLVQHEEASAATSDASETLCALPLVGSRTRRSLSLAHGNIVHDHQQLVFAICLSISPAATCSCGLTSVPV